MQDRNNRIVEDFLDGATDNELARSYGISSQQVLRVRKKAGVYPQHRRSSPASKKHADRRPISAMHLRIGHRINQRREVEHGESHDEMAIAVELSRDRLVEIERGITTATVLELEKISQHLEMSLTDLIGETA